MKIWDSAGNLWLGMVCFLPEYWVNVVTAVSVHMPPGIVRGL